MHTAVHVFFLLNAPGVVTFWKSKGLLKLKKKQNKEGKKIFKKCTKNRAANSIMLLDRNVIINIKIKEIIIKH